MGLSQDSQDQVFTMTLSTIDQWRSAESAPRRARMLAQRILILLISFCATAQQVSADEVNEFDEGADGWTAYPSTMGRGSESGWVNVTNDGEGSLRNNPTGTRYTYYWKMTRDLDLSNLDSPSLQLKYHFKGHSYDYFRIQIGEEGARRLSDFTVLHEATEATTDPSEVSIDLSEYQGERVRIQLILRKPYNVVERRIGLYLHRVAVVTPPQESSLEDTPGELRIAAFNVQVFGLSKMDKPMVVEALTQIINRFDLVMIQEVRDLSETAIIELQEQINAVSLHPYELFLSERLGRTQSKEQLAFLYRADKLRFVEGETVADPQDLYERPPVWTRFEHLESEMIINILGAHLDPDVVPSEIEALYNEFARYHLRAIEGEAAIVMGDFNAGCRYLTDSELAVATLFQTENLVSLLSDEIDTTTTSTYCPYDRILVGGAMIDSVLESGVYLYDQALGLTGEVTRSVSDHYPVWARFDMLGLADEEMAGEEMAGEEMASGEMAAGEMAAGEMDAGEMAAGEMAAGEMAAGEMAAGEMAAGEMSP